MTSLRWRLNLRLDWHNCPPEARGPPPPLGLEAALGPDDRWLVHKYAAAYDCHEYSIGLCGHTIDCPH